MRNSERTPPDGIEGLIIHGAGGHGLVVAEAAAAAGFTIVGFVDDALSGGFLSGIPILDLALIGTTDDSVIVAVGDCEARQRIQLVYTEAGRTVATVVHPSASISPSAQIGPGVFVGPNAVVHTEARVAEGAILNSRSIVEHHCRIGAFAHIAPGTSLGGSVIVGDLTLVGLGASVLPGISIGSRCTIGAGSVVREDVEDGITVVGNPAHKR